MFFYRAITAALIAVCCVQGVANAQTVNDFPKRTDPLHVRVDMFDALMRGNHWNEGAIMQHVIFPPAGEELPLVGNQEDCTGHTAVFLAAYAHRYTVTKDPQVRKWADEIMEGILKLEAVTGVPGWVARSFNKTEVPLWHEKTNFFELEWHKSTAMPGYRWQGDLSSDKLVALAYGVSTYYDFCADERHKKLAADFLGRFLGRVIDHDFRLVDVDNKMTLWGNFSPHLSHESLNALEILAALRATHHVTGEDRFLDAYQMLIEKYHYDDEAILAKVLWPDEWYTSWDDQLAVRSYYMVMRYETDADLLQKYRMGLNRHWYAWKKTAPKNDRDVFYRMVYQVLTGEQVVDEPTVTAIKDMWGFDRSKRMFTIPSPEGPVTLESEEERDASTMIRAYWFGRHYGIIDPKW